MLPAAGRSESDVNTPGIYFPGVFFFATAALISQPGLPHKMFL